MSGQPEALRLADACDTLTKLMLVVPGLDTIETAAELRRLHEVEKQRDELLEALEGVAWMSRCGQLDEFIGEPWLNAVHAAIAKAERATT